MVKRDKDIELMKKACTTSQILQSLAKQPTFSKNKPLSHQSPYQPSEQTAMDNNSRQYALPIQDILNQLKQYA